MLIWERVRHLRCDNKGLEWKPFTRTWTSWFPKHAFWDLYAAPTSFIFLYSFGDKSNIVHLQGRSTNTNRTHPAQNCPTALPPFPQQRGCNLQLARAKSASPQVYLILLHWVRHQTCNSATETNPPQMSNLHTPNHQESTVAFAAPVQIHINLHKRST